MSFEKTKKEITDTMEEGGGGGSSELTGYVLPMAGSMEVDGDLLIL